MKNYYRITEVHKADGFYPNWQNLVGSIIEADTSLQREIFTA